MPPAPPSFGSQQYWNQRFTSNSNPFEWLEAPTALDPFIVDALKDGIELQSEILHIGCGTSLLSYHLRAHVQNPKQIHNLDYSQVAIDVGKKRERDIYNGELAERSSAATAVSLERSEMEDGSNVLTDSASSQSNRSVRATQPTYMRWSAANLLDHSSLLGACKPNSYSVIVDKSTSDSIACSDDIFVQLPYHICARSSGPTRLDLRESPEPIHPLHIMAIHLALLTKPKGRWISLSYSMDRYPFIQQPPPEPTWDDTVSQSEPVAMTSEVLTSESPVSLTESDPTVSTRMAVSNPEVELEDNTSLDDDLDDIPQRVIDSGLPDPALLWKLLGKYEIEAPEQQMPNVNGSVTHRPKVLHWVYVLERTDVELCIRQHL